MKVLKIINDINKFVNNHGVAADRALNRMAIDIERLSKATVPVDKGQLRGSGRHERLGFLSYRTIFNKEYAAYQEFAPPGFKYTTPGTGRLYLKNAGDKVKNNAMSYFKQEMGNIKI